MHYQTFSEFRVEATLYERFVRNSNYQTVTGDIDGL